ncbi:MAG: threonylcarbamoyl-AMP synthase [Spirochaetales bacterium]|nr:threonylcarbamoyl-AMP synthase [Spirochaetales bacterium]
MIKYIYKTSIDETIMQKVKKILSEGGLVAYPTDTSWGIGCSINSKRGIERLQKLKGNFKKNTPTLICSSISQISDVALLDNKHFRLIKQYTPGPHVFILKAANKIEKKVTMKRAEIGVRIPDHPVPIKIVETLGSPIFSTTALKNLTELGWLEAGYAEEYLFECGWELEYIKELDLILDTGETLPKVLSTVIDMTDEEPVITRRGIGDIPSL